MQRSNIYETYQTGFKFEGLGPIPWGGLRGGVETKIKLFKYGRVAYQMKANDTCSNMVANVLPTDTPSTKGQTISFSESNHVAYQFKGN